VSINLLLIVVHAERLLAGLGSSSTGGHRYWTVAPAAPASEPAPTPPVQARAARLRPVKKNRKTDTYSEKMSTFLSPEMRDELEMTAKHLHRNRLEKGESITVHTLIRSGVRVLTELLEFTDDDVVSSEEELNALVRKKLGR
jgi:hypothetical protein